MTRIITIIYILCSLYSPNSTAPIDNLENYCSDSLASYYNSSNSIHDSVSNPTELPQENTDRTTIDIQYADELKNLGFLKQDSSDKKLNIRNAVIRFQSNCNMEVTGIWDENCMNALINRLSDTGFTYSDNINTSPSTGKWITINKTKRILTLYKDKTVIKKYPVAVGNPPSLTPSGKFSIYSKVKNPVWGGGGYAKPVKGGSPRNPLGYRWIGLSYGNGSRVGVHGNSSPYSIGRYVSHGCIRMINADVEELFNLVAVKIPVWIGTEKELGEWGVTQPEY